MELRSYEQITDKVQRHYCGFCWVLKGAAQAEHQHGRDMIMAKQKFEHPLTPSLGLLALEKRVAISGDMFVILVVLCNFCNYHGSYLNELSALSSRA